MGSRNRVGIGLSYRPASAGILEQTMGTRNRWVVVPARQATQPGALVPWNRFSLAPLKCKNSGSDMPLHATSTREDAAFRARIFKRLWSPGIDSKE
jgi:hypothetical protein